MSKDLPDEKAALLGHTTQIVSSYVSGKEISQDDMAELIRTVYDTLKYVSSDMREEAEAERPDPAVPIEQSLRDDVIICLEDGLPFQSLKRHLRVKYNLTPENYRKKWGLPNDYPMVAPDYAKRRSALAKRTGLGKNKG